MREAAFIRRNKEKWERLEKVGDRMDQLTADEASHLYIELMDDLSYARTFYPKSNVHSYLNGISSSTHQYIHRNERTNRSRFVTFWTQEVPLEMARSRRLLLLSFLIFGLAVLIGVLSAQHDPTFVRLILGDGYVNMTLENIKNGTPMAVYGDSGQMDMFLGITINNIRVSLTAFAAGLFVMFGTALILIFNGIMLGSFQYFFHEQGVLTESVLSIWVHGTLEISAIIIAGCAGLTIGSGFLFPGTYKRMVSFKRSAKRGLKIIVGLLPVFITAGFLESFVTRLAPDMPSWVSITIILISLAFIIHYFLIYPYYVERKQTSPAAGS